MNGLGRLLVAGAMFGLAGCGWGVESFLDQDIQGTDFNSYLAGEYQRRTEFEAKEEVEWRHAGRLAAKGQEAAAGGLVLPWTPSDWNVLAEDLPALESGRSRLMAALDSGGRERNPEACAKAQVYYDGWLEQANDNDFGEGWAGPVQPKHVEAEKAAFRAYVPLCEGIVEAKSFVVYFAWDRSDLTQQAMALLDEIASWVSQFTNPQLAIAGHTDTSGSDEYNLKLSERRATTVAAALTQRGVASLSTTWLGESEPAVPTGDGVREPLNRRVTVTVNQ